MERCGQDVQPFEAVVQVGAWETPYLCSGRGRDVLLLVDQPGRRLRLLERLATGSRVIAPTAGPGLDPPGHSTATAAAAAALETWIRGIIEGLGLRNPVVIASSALAPAAAAAAADATTPGDEPLAIMTLPIEPHAALLAALASR